MPFCYLLDKAVPVSVSESQRGVALHRLPHRGHAVRQPVQPPRVEPQTAIRHVPSKQKNTTLRSIKQHNLQVLL